jgi:hypothetical protein
MGERSQSRTMSAMQDYAFHFPYLLLYSLLVCGILVLVFCTDCRICESSVQSELVFDVI